MLSFFLFSIAFAAPPNIEKISVSEMYKIMYEPYELNASTPTTAQECIQKIKENIAFILRDHGDTTSGSGYKFYNVAGTPEEIAQFTAAAQLMNPINDPIEKINGSNKVIFVQFTREASYKQEAVFWVVIVTLIIFIGFVVSSLTIWHLDRYDLDPANSLLFVTEGNSIVAGTNDPK